MIGVLCLAMAHDGRDEIDASCRQHRLLSSIAPAFILADTEYPTHPRRPKLLSSRGLVLPHPQIGSGLSQAHRFQQSANRARAIACAAGNLARLAPDMGNSCNNKDSDKSQNHAGNHQQPAALSCKITCRCRRQQAGRIAPDCGKGLNQIEHRKALSLIAKAIGQFG